MTPRHVSPSGGNGAGSAETLARGLGWFSIGLGLAEVFGARTLNRTLGTGDWDGLVRLYGLREIGTGIGILTQKDPTPWVWARVAGDILDLATLAPALNRDNPRRDRAALAFSNVAVVTALDIACGLALSARERHDRPVPVYDYSDRTGLPKPPQAMRGAARDSLARPEAPFERL